VMTTTNETGAAVSAALALHADAVERADRAAETRARADAAFTLATLAHEQATRAAQADPSSEPLLDTQVRSGTRVANAKSALDAAAKSHDELVALVARHGERVEVAKREHRKAELLERRTALIAKAGESASALVERLVLVVATRSEVVGVLDELAAGHRELSDLGASDYMPDGTAPACGAIDCMLAEYVGVPTIERARSVKYLFDRVLVPGHRTEAITSLVPELTKLVSAPIGASSPHRSSVAAWTDERRGHASEFEVARAAEEKRQREVAATRPHLFPGERSGGNADFVVSAAPAPMRALGPAQVGEPGRKELAPSSLAGRGRRS